MKTDRTLPPEGKAVKNKKASGGRVPRLVGLGPAIHRAKCATFTPYTGVAEKIERRSVKVMAVADGWAMVRRKGAMPYCVPTKDLSQPNPPISGGIPSASSDCSKP